MHIKGNNEKEPKAKKLNYPKESLSSFFPLKKYKLCKTSSPRSKLQKVIRNALQYKKTR